jgi:hypothetical protein
MPFKRPLENGPRMSRAWSDKKTDLRFADMA